MERAAYMNLCRYVCVCASFPSKISELLSNCLIPAKQQPTPSPTRTGEAEPSEHMHLNAESHHRSPSQGRGGCQISLALAKF